MGPALWSILTSPCVLTETIWLRISCRWFRRTLMSLDPDAPASSTNSLFETWRSFPNLRQKQQPHQPRFNLRFSHTGSWFLLAPEADGRKGGEGPSDPEEALCLCCWVNSAGPSWFSVWEVSALFRSYKQECGVSAQVEEANVERCQSLLMQRFKCSLSKGEEEMLLMAEG